MGTIVRKKDTGEPGNKGEFGHTSKASSGLVLGAAGRFAGMTPSQVDEIAYRAYQRAGAAQHRQERAFTMLRHATDPGGRSWNQKDTRTIEEVLEAAEKKAKEGGFDAYACTTGLREVEAARADAVEANTELEEAEQEWRRRGGWSRAFLVVGGGDGHVHSSMRCQTCNRSGQPTQFQWMTDYSGMDEAQIVAAAGYRACTVCYPSAPLGDAQSLPTRMFSTEEEEKAKARAERERRAQERREKAIAAGLTPDGSPLRVQYVETNAPGWDRDPATGQQVHRYADRPRTEEFKTERTAVTWYTDYLPIEDLNACLPGNRGDREPVFAAIEQAIAAKRGVPVDEVVVELREKAYKKRR